MSVSHWPSWHDSKTKPLDSPSKNTQGERERSRGRGRHLYGFHPFLWLLACTTRTLLLCSLECLVLWAVWRCVCELRFTTYGLTSSLCQHCWHSIVRCNSWSHCQCSSHPSRNCQKYFNCSFLVCVCGVLAYSQSVYVVLSCWLSTPFFMLFITLLLCFSLSLSLSLSLVWLTHWFKSQ